MLNKIVEKNSIQKLSPHLFWDVDKSKITWDKNEHFLVQRILEYGHDKDWQALKNVYGLRKIVEISKELKSLDDISLNFIATITKTPIEKFRCFKLKQSIPNFSGY